MKYDTEWRAFLGEIFRENRKRRQIRLAKMDWMLYALFMNELIDAGDPRTKVVGRRSASGKGNGPDWERFDQMQQNFQRLWGRLPFRKGVYRFKTWESYDEWKTNLMMRNAPGRR